MTSITTPSDNPVCPAPAADPSGQALAVSGVGLITGKPVHVEITRTAAGQGIVFFMDGVSAIPARLESVAHTDRGMTLANREGKTLSIVEHFLCAASLAGLSDLRVSVSGAPEMPILDGSARDWLSAFASAGWIEAASPSLDLPAAVFYRHSDDICIYALPDTHFKITYAVDFTHPDLRNRWVRWDSRANDPAYVADSVTFGYVSELPALQARGMALGADPKNTLGLIETGGYTRPLRHEDEPIFHKALDLIGDLTLASLNPLSLKAHVFAVNAGHSSHTAFARQLLATLAR